MPSSTENDLIFQPGARFGRWVIVSADKHYDKWKKIMHECHCDCGSERVVLKRDLKSGKSTSCGCLTIENGIKSNTKHGFKRRDSAHELYGIWAVMRGRCNNPENKSYKHYGGRGISVCERWNDFKMFAKDMGDRPEGLSIDRINNDGDYEPSNCKWSTAVEQANNRRKPGCQRTQ